MRRAGVVTGVLGACMAMAIDAAAEGEGPQPQRDTAERATPHDAKCEGTFSVFHPVPEDCYGKIDTDRPHKTDTPGVLEPGHAQIEMGVVEYEVERLAGPSDNSVVLMNNIYKLGVVDGLDVQALYAVGSYAQRSKRFALEKEMMFRAKLNLVGERGFFGHGDLHVTLVPAVIAPIARSGTTEAGGFVFLGAELPGDIDFELNVGGFSETDRDTRRRHIAPVITTAFTRHIGGPVAGFIEWYNDSTTVDLKRWNATADTGLLFAVHKDVQLDAGAYVGLYGEVPAITPFLGLSARR